jgi:hypothetical protein
VSSEDTLASILSRALSLAESSHILAKEGNVVILAAGKTLLKKELGDVSVRVEESGDQLALGSHAEQRSLDLTLQQTRLEELLCLVAKGLSSLLLSIGSSPLGSWSPDTSNSHDRLHVLIGRNQETQDDTVSIQDLLNDTLQLFSLVFIHKALSVGQFVAGLDETLGGTGPDTLLLILGERLQSTQAIK